MTSVQKQMAMIQRLGESLVRTAGEADAEIAELRLSLRGLLECFGDELDSFSVDDVAKRVRRSWEALGAFPDEEVPGWWKVETDA